MKISVVTVCWNAEKTIRHTLESFLEQTHPDREMLIVDGLSKDSTLDIVRSYNSPLIKITSEKDKGIYDAQNKGVRLATGDVIGILNADDTYHDKTSLARIAKALETADIVTAPCNMVPDHVSGVVARVHKVTPFEHGSFARGWHPPHPTTYARRAVWEKVGNFDTNYYICADYDWMLRAFELYNFRVAVLEEPLAHMMLGGLSTSGLKASLTNMRETSRARQKWLGAGPVDRALMLKAWGRMRRMAFG